MFLKKKIIFFYKNMKKEMKNKRKEKRKIIPKRFCDILFIFLL